MTEKETDVLIVGAGPTGLVLALWLTRLGIRVRIIDKTSRPLQLRCAKMPTGLGHNLGHNSVFCSIPVPVSARF